uniref:NADH dehydrogenase subunit 5 n=1 Tax=Lefroyothrips lefroyi TaxID=1030666 RepID=UPI00292A414F|nr:NADH dehydrogenase subunit 5 [Lefroyothrips lefroyi]WNL54549.1 NADH dehydrogenase subunit 5 [Lefroyothrips lefroyi]
MFFIMSFFFIFSSVVMFFLSSLFLNLNFSFFVQWNFFSSSFSVSFPLYFDSVSCVFMGMVLLISGSIIFYSQFYMEHEIYKSRFFFLMFLFVVSMVFLILSPNFFCMLLGWDGLGLISFCLVMYYQNFKSVSSAVITALTNRVGDVFILATIAMYFSMGSWSYMNFFYSANIYWVSLFFFIASLTKSAQIPFSAWLPAAMAAPTPVSSLVHSSTLVTAGVYIMIRFGFFLSPEIKKILMFISLLTMIMSGLCGVLEYDLKKIIALSTLSQLGFMMFTISLGFFDLAFFHLISHASFKALLFMCAGLFIHQFSDNQDIRNFGLLDKNYFFSICMFNVANLSLCGFPFLSGFFSKDLILEMCMMGDLHFLFFFLVMFGTFLTVFYSFRLFIFLSLKKVYIFSYDSLNMKFMKIHLSMLFLYVFSICLGYVGSNLLMFPYNFIVFPFFLKIFVLLICLSSLMFCLMFSSFYWKVGASFIIFISQMWFLTFLKTDFLKSFVFNLSTKFSKSLYGFIEEYFGLKVSYSLKMFSYLLNSFMTQSFIILFMTIFLFLVFFLCVG